MAIIAVRNKAAHENQPEMYVSRLQYMHVDKKIGTINTYKKEHAAIFPFSIANVLAKDLNNHFDLYEYMVVEIR